MIKSFTMSSPNTNSLWHESAVTQSMFKLHDGFIITHVTLSTKACAGRMVVTNHFKHLYLEMVLTLNW